jgi:hypothetical protein
VKAALIVKALRTTPVHGAAAQRLAEVLAVEVALSGGSRLQPAPRLRHWLGAPGPVQIIAQRR